MTLCVCVFFNDTATTEIYTLSLHDALPIYDGVQEGAHRDGRRRGEGHPVPARARPGVGQEEGGARGGRGRRRSEEHTFELQSRQYLVCRLLLEKKKQTSIRSQQVHIILYTI